MTRKKTEHEQDMFAAWQIKNQLKLRGLGPALMAVMLFKHDRPVPVSELLALIPATRGTGDRSEATIRTFATYLREGLGTDAVLNAYTLGYHLSPAGRARLEDIIKPDNALLRP